MDVFPDPSGPLTVMWNAISMFGFFFVEEKKRDKEDGNQTTSLRCTTQFD
jgi:hypothetical protein